ncbi:MAG: cob(I)yrinic acid a,c-diamide adenosyltransferase [Lachnospiraceae bacterium]
MIQVYHGDGKGKTTAAIGLAVRFSGAGKKALFCQFMKGNISSEIGALRKLENLEVELIGKNFGFYKDMTEQDKEEITKCHNHILEKVLRVLQNAKSAGQEPAYQESEVQELQDQNQDGPALLVVLDELASAYRYGLLDRDLVSKIILVAGENREKIELVITGRDPDPFFLENADYITEMKMQRHPYEKGILARKGIEW